MGARLRVCVPACVRAFVRDRAHARSCAWVHDCMRASERANGRALLLVPVGVLVLYGGVKKPAGMKHGVFHTYETRGVS